MSELTLLQQRLARARSQLAAARQAHLEAREAVRRADERLAGLARTFDPRDPEQARRKKALETERARLAEIEARAVAAKGAAGKEVGAGLSVLVGLGEPDRIAGGLDDRHPILLFPLRLETRWKKVTRDGATVDQLWLRIYPDDCQIETFTEILSESELANVKAFWTSFWAAGDVEAQERAAWRGLVNAHGSGRAGWLVGHFVPANPGDRPTKIDPGDLLLVLASDARLDAAAEAATLAFWPAWWRAGDDATARNAARATLRAAVGNALATTIEREVVPPNLGDRPPAGKSRADVRVAAAFIRFPADDSVPLSTSSWLQAPAARTLPDRFVILGFRGGQQVLRKVTDQPVSPELHVGPDPGLPESQQMKHQDGDLVLNEELRWMADFDEAIARGMGAKIDVSPADVASGFEQLLVLGLRASSDAATGAAELEKLLGNHLSSSNGFALLPQGTPTNNTEGTGAGFHSLDDADGTFDRVFKGHEAFTDESAPLARADGQWLAEGLGISTALLQQVSGAGGADQAEARAMNTALWPATWGYFLEQMMTPLVPAADIAATRAFFSGFVSGRGALPALRIGRQPYGVLPATAFSRLAFSGREGAYRNRLHAFLGQLDAQWEVLEAGVATVTKAGDPHQLLLDVLGLHPGSVEFHQRYAQSFQQMYNALVLKLGQPWAGLLAAAQQQTRAALVAAAGLPPNGQAPIFEKYFLGKANLLQGDVVDDLPLSESRPVRPYTADQKNYLTWLKESALETIRMQDFGGKDAPTALLYLWLRHALMLSFWDGGLRLYEAVGLETVRTEPDFIHVEGSHASESKWLPLYQTLPATTGNATVAEHLSRPEVIATTPQLADLAAVKAALGRLEQTPTARLERLFVEHVDCCHYRLDAWKNGLIAARLAELRAQDRRGVYLGGYGYLENVRSENKTFTPVPLSPELARVFQPEGQPAPARDDTNAGFIHAPSIGQATAAAVLKSAYLGASGPEDAGTYAVDLSSQRVRKALALLEGIRNGQSLSALLGYQFERGLHDRHALAEVDKFIYPLRMKFPLVANKQKDTVAPAGTSIDAVEARNVLDALALLEHLKTSPSGYPFGFTDLPPASTAEAAAIDAEVASLREASDGVGDLVLSESVYQVVQGNFDRASANADALAKGGYPPEIEVVKTPRSGRALTQRCALHFDTGVDPDGSPEPLLIVTPRARAEAPVNHWLHGLLPRPGDISCRISVTSHVDGTTTARFVTPKLLGLQPIDLLLAAAFDSETAMTDLDDRIWHHLKYVALVHPLDDFKIEYMVAQGAGPSFFEAGALLRSLRSVLLKSRSLRPEHLALTQEGRSGTGDFDTDELATRIGAATTALLAHVSDLEALAADGTGTIDAFVKRVADRLVAVGLFGVPGTSPGFLFSELGGIFRALVSKLRAVVDRWTERIAAYDGLEARLASATTDDERLELLAGMEAAVSPATTTPRPTSVGPYQAAVTSARGDLDQLHARLKGHLATGTAELSAFMAALLPDVQRIATFDSVAFDRERGANVLAAEEGRVADLRAEAQRKVRLLADELTDRGDRVTGLLADAATKNTSAEKLEPMLAAGKLVLGDDFPLLPRFRLTTEQGDELALAFADSDQLLAHQRSLSRRFPVDDWLYGVARVRDKMFHVENTVFLAEALRGASPGLTPIQLPYQPADSWLALEYPPGYQLQSEKLLYTAHLARPFDRTAAQAGVLVDEWTEVIPSSDEVTGLAFHYDQPSTEPPQVMLLLVPPQLEGAWKWQDIVDGVRETFAMARKRAVEPAQVDDSPYAQFLPATLMAVTLHQITIATNLAANNGLYDDLAKA